MDWIRTRNDVGGILTPDIRGKRKLFDIGTHRLYDFEKDTTDLMNTVAIGRYVFDAAIFKLAQKILTEAVEHKYGWIVVDEIGKLELHQQNGLEPVVSQLIKQYQAPSATGNLMIVVRDYLLADCVKHYNLIEPAVINKTNFDLVVAK
jgi:nucleoside-triphosphatase THEP1